MLAFNARLDASNNLGPPSQRLFYIRRGLVGQFPSAMTCRKYTCRPAHVSVTTLDIWRCRYL